MPEKQQTNQEDHNDIISIPHRESSKFISDYASGAVITGPTLEHLYFLTFYADSVTIKNEVGKVSKSDKNEDIPGNAVTYELIMAEAEVESFREDKARIVMSKASLISLKNLLNQIEF